MATDESAQLQLDNAQRVRDIASEQGRDIAEYIDVRIPFRGYYR